jgi:tripartite-type tricarboxylate transporter receptor subunit TctC
MICLNRLFALAFAVACSGAALAQAYPSRAIRLIIPFGPGSSTDVVARILADRLQDRLGQPVIVESRPGANGSVAAETVAKSAPDGYTIMLASNGTHAINVSLFSKLSYDPLKDFEPISQIGIVSFVVTVRTRLPVRTVSDLVAMAKANPERVSLGSTGSVTELAGTLFEVTTNSKFNRVPYKAPATALVDIMGDRLDVLLETPPAQLQHIEAGLLRAIAVTSKQRSPLLPQVPTVAESGYPEYEAVAWQALFAPAGTPRPIIQQLNAAVVAVLNSPEVKASILGKGVEVSTTTPARLTEIVKADIDRWKKLFRDANVAKVN